MKNKPLWAQDHETAYRFFVRFDRLLLVMSAYLEMVRMYYTTINEEDKPVDVQALIKLRDEISKTIRKIK